MPRRLDVPEKPNSDPVAVKPGAVLTTVLSELLDDVLSRIGQEEFEKRFPKGVDSIEMEYTIRSRLEGFILREIEKCKDEGYTPTQVTFQLKNHLRQTAAYATWHDEFLAKLNEPQTVDRRRAGYRSTGSHKA